MVNTVGINAVILAAAGFNTVGMNAVILTAAGFNTVGMNADPTSV
jgi:hypothetical protein